MKGKNREKIVSLPIVTFTILTILLCSIPTTLANSQIMVSFYPHYNEPPSKPINPYPPNKSTNVKIPVRDFQMSAHLLNDFR